MPTTADLLAELRHLTSSGEAREIREDAELSQPEVAAEAEVSPATISRWEAGLARPRGDAALRYYRLLKRLQVKAQQRATA